MSTRVVVGVDTVPYSLAIPPRAADLGETMKKLMLAATIAALTPSAASALTTVTMSGNLVSSIAAINGQAFTATYVYDEQTAATNGRVTAYNGAGRFFSLQSSAFSFDISAKDAVNNAILITDAPSGSLDYYTIIMNNNSQKDPKGFNVLFSGVSAISSNRLINPTDGKWSAISLYVTDGDVNPSASISSITAVTNAVPEPATWAMMLLGFGMIGAAARYRDRITRLAVA